MPKITELKVGKYKVKYGQYPDGYRFSIINPDKTLFKMGLERSEVQAVQAAKDIISNHTKGILSSEFL